MTLIQACPPQCMFAVFMNPDVNNTITLRSNGISEYTPSPLKGCIGTMSHREQYSLCSCPDPSSIDHILELSFPFYVFPSTMEWAQGGNGFPVSKRGNVKTADKRMRCRWPGKTRINHNCTPDAVILLLNIMKEWEEFLNPADLGPLL